MQQQFAELLTSGLNWPNTVSEPVQLPSGVFDRFIEETSKLNNEYMQDDEKLPMPDRTLYLPKSSQTLVSDTDKALSYIATELCELVVKQRRELRELRKKPNLKRLLSK